jgi:hypothetical protein
MPSPFSKKIYNEGTGQKTAIQPLTLLLKPATKEYPGRETQLKRLAFNEPAKAGGRK